MATSSMSARQAANVLRAIKPTTSIHSSFRPRCCIHYSASRGATPLPLANFPGPPPSAPQAAVADPKDRVARKKQQAEALRESQRSRANPSRPQTALQKRFWRNVSVKDKDAGIEIHLDTRPVRTSSRQVLSLPPAKLALAHAIALEWDQLVSAQQATKQHYIPLTSLASRVLDLEQADATHGAENEIRQSIIEMLMRYLSTDTLLCWAPEKNIHEQFNMSAAKSLRQRQREVAEPIIAFLTTHCFPGVEIVPILGEDSIVPISQPAETLAVIRGWVNALPAYELAAVERGVLATKSFLVATRLMAEWSTRFTDIHPKNGVHPEEQSARFGVEEAAEAANLEVLHQTQQWGEVEDTHDVDKEDLRRQLGSVILLVS